MDRILHDANNAQRILKLTADTMLLVDRHGVCVDIEPHCDLWFLQEDILLGKNIFELLPEYTRERVMPIFQIVLEEQRSISKNFKLVLNDEIFYFKCLMFPYDGMVLCQYRDITQRSNVKRRLEQANLTLRAIQKVAQIGQWAYNTNQNIFHYLGYTGVLCEESVQNLAIEKYVELIVEEDRQSFREWCRVNERELNMESISYRVRLNGEIFYMRIQTYLREERPDGSFNIEGYIQNITDIQHRRNDINTLTHAINNAKESIFAARPDGTIIFANRRFLHNHGIPESEDISQLKIYNVAADMPTQEAWDERCKDVIHGGSSNFVANDYHFKVMMGHNLYQEEWKNENVQAQNLVVDGLYTYTNAKSTTPVNYYEKKRLVGLYGDISLGYKDMLFVNVTGRNDWSSTLPINNRSYFYPSISGSFIFTELMENKDILNFGKVRLSYANVGSDEDPYNLAFKYTPASTYFLQYLGNVNTFPHMGLVGFTGPRVLPNENLKPQNQSSFEVGADLRFFGGKIRLDMTYYSNITKNQIVSIDVPLSTGYFANNINAGKIANKGVEVTLGLTPVETRDFKWDLDATFASNKQTVEELAEGLDEYTLTSGLSGLQIKAAKGDSFGLYGTGWKRDDQGNYVINSKTGLRETVNNVRLGDVYPDFTMGINNTFTYKGVTLSFLIDIRHGGSLYSETVANLRSSGLAAETIAHREDASFIEPGVILQDDGTYRPNDVPVKSMQDYWQHISNSSNNEGNIYNASFVKLREVQLSYSFPRKWFKSFFVKSLDLGFEARNLWIIKDHVPHIDPEANFFGPSQIGGGVEFNSIPSTRSFGFNVRLTL